MFKTFKMFNFHLKNFAGLTTVIVLYVRHEGHAKTCKSKHKWRTCVITELERKKNSEHFAYTNQPHSPAAN